jgi:hypothetical protein
MRFLMGKPPFFSHAGRNRYFAILTLPRLQSCTPVALITPAARVIPSITSVSFARVRCQLLSHIGRNNLVYQRFEALVAAEIIKHWIGFDLSDVGVALTIRSFHLIDRALFVVQSQIH